MSCKSASVIAKITTFRFLADLVYTKYMKIALQSKPNLLHVHAAATLLAVILTIFALAQLFAFDELAPAIGTMLTVGPSAHLIAASLVVAEVFALPFLLRLRMDTAFRVTSMILGWIAITMLLILVSKEVALHQTHSILLGAKIPLVAGMWNILLMLALGILAFWAGWGMWPFRKSNPSNTSQKRI
jgi:hypothetical protein